MPEIPLASHFPIPVLLTTAPRLPSRTSRLRPPSRARPQITITITTTTYPFQSTCPRLRPRPTRRRPLRPLLGPLPRLLRLGLERGTVAGRPAWTVLRLSADVRGGIGRSLMRRTQGSRAGPGFRSIAVTYSYEVLYQPSPPMQRTVSRKPRLSLSALSSTQCCVTRNRVRVCNLGSTNNR